MPTFTYKTPEELRAEADAIEAVVGKVLKAGHRTRDISGGGPFIGTVEMGDLIVQGLNG